MDVSYDTGTTAWILVCTALVLLMTPGLAIFYAGMVRSKNALAMLVQNFIAIVVVSITWVLVGFSLAFGTDVGGGLIGNLDGIGLGDLSTTAAVGFSFPPLLFVMFQMMFAILTAALITGASADRIKFSALILFLIGWSILVYPTIAHWAWGPDGWMGSWGVLDFAGGTVVEICSGASALALVLVLGPRTGWPKERMMPHNLPLTLLGAGLLWFGWIGFNAGSALAADADAVSAAFSTHMSAVGGMVGWLLLEKRVTGKPTALGAASGAVAGLVAITPAAGFLDAIPATLLGVIAGAVSLYAIKLKFRFKYDDTLDVVAVHYVSGVVGMLFLGFFARATLGAGGAGLGLFTSAGIADGGAQLGKQVVAIIAASAFAFVASYGIARVIRATIGLRVPPHHEREGLDSTTHGEGAYEIHN